MIHCDRPEFKVNWRGNNSISSPLALAIVRSQSELTRSHRLHPPTMTIVSANQPQPLHCLAMVVKLSESLASLLLRYMLPTTKIGSLFIAARSKIKRELLLSQLRLIAEAADRRSSTRQHGCRNIAPTSCEQKLGREKCRRLTSSMTTATRELALRALLLFIATGRVGSQKQPAGCQPARQPKALAFTHTRRTNLVTTAKSGSKIAPVATRRALGVINKWASAASGGRD